MFCSNVAGHFPEDLFPQEKSVVLSKLSYGLQPEDLSDDTVAQHLMTADMPDPDLVIRTGGEVRISNFLLWQAAYSELYFTDTLWPDFDEDCFDNAIDAFRARNRRFGKTREQT